MGIRKTKVPKAKYKQAIMDKTRFKRIYSLGIKEGLKLLKAKELTLTLINILAKFKNN
jgi:hypothetical protein